MVNINDIDDFVSEVPLDDEDMLRAIFRRQAELKKKYDEIEKKNGFHVPDGVANLDDAHDQHYLKDFAWRITEEVGEAMNCLKNKPWKQSQMATDKEHFVEELVDGFHFYVELLINVGLTAEDLYNLYCKKNRVNQFRQRSGY